MIKLRISCNYKQEKHYSPVSLGKALTPEKPPTGIELLEQIIKGNLQRKRAQNLQTALFFPLFIVHRGLERVFSVALSYSKRILCS